MNIELRNVQFQDRQTEETTAFTASLWIENKKVGWASNSGKGEMTRYHLDNYHDNNAVKLLREAEQFCKELPPMNLDHLGIHEGDNSVTIPMDLSNYIDNLVDEAWKAREEKRFNKLKTTHQKNCILIGNDQQYKRITLLYPIDELLKTLQGKKALKELVAKHKNQLRPGEKILNTNIPSEIL